MKCGYCNGTGEHINDANRMTTCEFCGGTGVIKPMTNEEWLEQASTEEKARFLEMICYSAWGDKNSRFKDMADYTDWMDWLKEKHHGNS